MLKQKAYGWAIVSATTGKLEIFDAREPIYWLRRIAVEVANERGLTTSGPKANVRVCAVEIRQFTGSKLPNSRSWSR